MTGASVPSTENGEQMLTHMRGSLSRRHLPSTLFTLYSFVECSFGVIHFSVTEPSFLPSAPSLYFHSMPLAFASGMTASDNDSKAESSLPAHKSNSSLDFPSFSMDARSAPNSAASSFGSAGFDAAVWAPAEPHPASISNAADAARHFDSRFMIPSIFSPVTPPWPDLGEQPTTSPHSGLTKLSWRLIWI